MTPRTKHKQAEPEPRHPASALAPAHSFSEPREWLTRGEIRDEANSVVDARLDRQNATLDRIAEGQDKISESTQGVLQTLTLLMGIPEHGIKGIIPDLADKVTSIDQRERQHHEENRVSAEQNMKTTLAETAKNRAAIEALQVEIEEMKKSVGRFRRAVNWLLKLLVQMAGKNPGDEDEPAGAGAGKDGLGAGAGKKSRGTPVWLTYAGILLAAGAGHVWDGIKWMGHWIAAHFR